MLVNGIYGNSYWRTFNLYMSQPVLFKLACRFAPCHITVVSLYIATIDLGLTLLGGTHLSDLHGL